MSKNKKNTISLTKTGLDYAKKDQFNEVTKLLNKSLNVDFKPASVLFDLGNTYARKGEFDLAIEQYNKALVLEPKNVGILYNLGNTYNRKGEFNLAIEQYNKALVLDPKQAAILYNLGLIHAHKEEFNEAIELFNKALVVDPKQVNTLCALGNTYNRKGEFNLAIEQYNKALVLDPKQVNTLCGLGNAYAQEGEFNLAIEQYNKALVLAPKNAGVLSNLGNTYAQEGEFNLAIEQYNKALVLEPKNVGVLYNLGNTYYLKGEFNLAIEQYNKALVLEPKNVGILYNLGNTYVGKNKIYEATEQYNKILGIDSKQVKTLFNMGLVHAHKEEFNEAIELFNKALVIDPKDVNTLRALGNIYNRKGEFDEAIETYVNCIKYSCYDKEFSRTNKDLMIKINEIEEKKAAVKLIENKTDKQHFANNIDEVIEIVLSLRIKNNSLFFRGQNDFKWDLTSTHERVNGTQIELSEKLTQFKISIQAHLNIDDNLDDGNYYALMQHYGIHTPFIDFSEFLNTALYFAITDSNLGTTNSIPCIWVLIAKENQKISLFEINEEKEKLEERYGNKILYPNLKDKRIRAQNGVFVWSDNKNPLNKNDSFELHQIIIFGGSKNDALTLNQKIRDTLELSSTSATKIYPDDKGLAYEINYQSKGIKSNHNIKESDNASFLEQIKNNKIDFI